MHDSLCKFPILQLYTKAIGTHVPYRRQWGHSFPIADNGDTRSLSLTKGTFVPYR
jgi:hypothetical protein